MSAPELRQESRLETALLGARPIGPTKEWEIDILRSILRGELGTQAQRAQLTRLVSQYKPRKSAIAWIHSNLLKMSESAMGFQRATYTTEYSVTKE